jgi:hypothetical protein
MTTVSTRSLKLIAALIWYGGGIVLVFKGYSLLAEAEALRPGQIWPWLAAVAGVVAGGLQAKYVFSRSCKRNLDRIDALEEPRIWLFFRPGFMVALVTMIITGATLSRLAHGKYLFLLLVGALDLNIATALLGSSYVFWREKALGGRDIRG